MKGKQYSPGGAANAPALRIARAAKKAAGRAEEYRFKSKNSSSALRGIDSMISSEMRSLRASKKKLMDLDDIWQDRNSAIAAPLLADDMFLNCESGSSNIMFSGPRFFHNELSQANEDPASGIPLPPDVTRFPYSDAANEASKTLARKLAQNLAKRHYAAAVLQVRKPLSIVNM